jgi:tRNA pseudouridine55 synthase
MVAVKDQETFGFLNVHKPSGMTSHDVVSRVRRLMRMKRVGHGGTLDPLAQGVLPVALGQACRLLRYMPGNKTYLAEILLGQRTTTDDTEGEVVSRADPLIVPDKEAVKDALTCFVGSFEQVPPDYSAVHHQGKRLYQLARAGVSVENVPARLVRVDSIEIVDMQQAVLTVRIACGSGTYIRSIARDLGDKLGCGACLQALTREVAGPFHLGAAVNLERLEEACRLGETASTILAPDSVLGRNPDLFRLEVDDDSAKRISMGQSVLCPHSTVEAVRADQRIMVCSGRWLLAICTLESDRLKAEVVINRDSA